MKMRFLAPLTYCALLALGGAASAQDNPATATAAATAPDATPEIPSRVPPTSVTPKIAAEVKHVQRLVREVRENTDNIQNRGDFGAQLWLVQGNDFFENWKKPQPPTIDPISLVTRGGPAISTVIIFYGTARSGTGASNVDYDIVVKRPNGTIYNRRDDLVGWQDLAPTNGQMMLGRNYVTLTFSPDDPVGVYTVEVTVRDNVSREALVLKQTFVVQ